MKTCGRSAQGVRGLVRHLLLDPTPEQLACAVDRSSFQRLQEQEDSEGFREKPKAATRFFREGRAGQWERGADAGGHSRRHSRPR